jgi:hypothetical protein
MANSYKVLAATRVDDTVITEVQYSFDGRLVTVPVSHFRPQSKADVAAGIRNRGISERDKLIAADTIEALLAGFQTGTEVVLP